MATIKRSTEGAQGEYSENSLVRFKKTYVLNAEGMIVQPQHVYNVVEEMDGKVTWMEEWEVGDDSLAIEILCTNSRWGDAFDMVYMPTLPSVKQMVSVEDLLNDYGMSLINADPYQQTMAYVEAKVYPDDKAVAPFPIEYGA